MLSAPKCFWYNKSIFALRNKNCFDRKPKMTKKTVNPWLPAPPRKNGQIFSCIPGKIQYRNALKIRRFFCLLVFERFKLFFNVRKVRNQKASCCDEK